jgi:UDP-N-acetylglucosamine 2-epimerase (non-hydrolysing)
MAPVIAELRRSHEFDCAVVATGQHREMLDQVAKQFGVTIDADLDVMEPKQSLASLTARLVQGIDRWLEANRPEMALAQGDTTTVLCVALACFYRGVPFGHVEAGLRTGNLFSPFPEEANRRLVSVLAAIHFAPTDSARESLLREGVPAERITVTGNTVVDALLLELERQRNPNVQAEIGTELATLLGPDWATHPLVLITGHRRENFGEGIAQICEAIAALASEFPEHRFVYPVHLNPNVRDHVLKRLGGLANVALIPPQDYQAFVALMSRCRLVLTDSGGVQEEAPSLGKPVLVMRDTTERPEGTLAGTALLTGASADRIVRETRRLLTDAESYAAMTAKRNPFGDGQAAPRIVARLREYFAI